MSKKKFKTITSRIEEIKEIIGDKYITPLIDIDNKDNPYNLLQQHTYENRRKDT